MAGLVAACGAVAHPGEARGDLATEVTLYDDGALVKQRVDADVPATRMATVRVEVPLGTAFGDIAVIDRGELAIHELREVAPASGSAGSAGSAAATAAEPHELVDVEVEAPHPGHYAFTIAYATPRLTWSAAYTVTTTAARDRAVLHGAISVSNTGGVALRGAHVRVVDERVAAARQNEDAIVVAQLTGSAAPTTPPAPVRDLGVVDLVAGETRLELVHDPRRSVRSVLVYDPIGTALDNPNPTPTLDEDRGITESKSKKVSESIEISRAPGDTGLPAGPVRVLERRPDGTLTVLADGRMFEASARVASTDTVAIGIADDVTGKRERRDFSVDDDAHRLVEEFSIEVANERTAAIDVLVREHMYRGATWSIGYWNIQDSSGAGKEGQQQIAMRATVPAHGTKRLYYVVVYWW